VCDNIFFPDIVSLILTLDDLPVFDGEEQKAPRTVET
jgi:hypothetical protein